MGLTEIFVALGQMAALGASPAVQQIALAALTKAAGISQAQLDAALAAAAYVPPPKTQ